MPSENQPVPVWKEYPEPEFPSEKAKPLREWKPRNAGWANVMEALKEKNAGMQKGRGR